MAEIKISYLAKPMGQIGDRPQKIDRDESCVFTCSDPGTLEIEFVDGSPTDSGATKFGRSGTFVAHRSGKFKFACTFTKPDGTKIHLDPHIGGEIEIGL
jgi:hypothetical protein